MENKEVQSLLYLNNERIEVLSSREYFVGKKALKYLGLLKHFRILKIGKELGHDIYAFFNKNNSSHHIINFSQNKAELLSKKVVVYTCIYGNYDKILEPLYIDPNCEYYIFTDIELPKDSAWKKADDSIIPFECDTPNLKNRYVKMFPQRVFDCRHSIYIDGNLQAVGPLSDLVQKGLLKNKTGISMHLAPRETCIYEEAKSACHIGKISKHERNQILQKYRGEGMPHQFGMFECNVIVRDHENENLESIMNKWWECYKNGIKRDQLYFTYVLFKKGYNFGDVSNFGASVNLNPYFIRKSHL